MAISKTNTFFTVRFFLFSCCRRSSTVFSEVELQLWRCAGEGDQWHQSARCCHRQRRRWRQWWWRWWRWRRSSGGCWRRVTGRWKFTAFDGRSRRVARRQVSKRHTILASWHLLSVHDRHTKMTSRSAHQEPTHTLTRKCEGKTRDRESEAFWHIMEKVWAV